MPFAHTVAAQPRWQHFGSGHHMLWRAGKLLLLPWHGGGAICATSLQPSPRHLHQRRLRLRHQSDVEDKGQRAKGKGQTTLVLRL